MKKILKRILAIILAAAMTAGSFPAAASASEASPSGADKLELNDKYISVTVSGENGGFLIDTLKGNKLDKADDNKYLLYPAADYDTSYTSFRITRTDGDVEDYVFGRDYGFLGWDSSDVTLAKEGNSIVATWRVKDLTIMQKLALQDVTASQHGLVNISYDVTSTKDDVADCKVRVMIDTALGFQDYAVYQLPNEAGDFNTVLGETLLNNDRGQAYNKTFFAVNDGMNPTITAYSLDSNMNGEKISPYQVAYGHWNNLASTVFDFVPDPTLNFTTAYNAKYMTADSAFAQYYDLGALEQGKTSGVALYYGVYSNSTVDDTERAAINFTVLPASMELNEEKDAYHSQVKNGRPGDIELQMLIENLSGEIVDDVTVVVKTQNNITAYESWYDNVKYDDSVTYTQVTSDVLPGEEITIDAFFQVTPLSVSEYRRFEILVYDAGKDEELTDAKLMGSRDFYLLCPGELGEVVAFNSISPQILYYKGTRQLFLSGLNFGLLKDTSAYTTILRPVAGGDDVVIPSKNVVVDSGTNTINLIIDEEMVPGAYQVYFDWNEAGKEDTTSAMLQFQVSDDLTYFSPAYGIVTVEKTSDTTYRLGTYQNEDAYKKAVKDPDNTVLLEIRGNFGVRYDENGNIIEATAISVEDELGNASGTINISNCLDIEAGNVSVFVENPGEEDQTINVDMDGRVYTTNARTKVWDGICCLTSIENGEEYSLIQYKYDGSRAGDLENSLANKNVITLLWPAEASAGQSLAGLIFNLEYCQFGQIATEIGETVTEDTPKARVIAFGGELAADFLIPSNKFTLTKNTTMLEKVQLTFAKSNYTADQLRDVQERYAADEEAAEDAQGGILNLQVQDVLFGGGFIGFNTTLDVGVPSYASGYPGLEGILHLNIMPSIKAWEVGVKGIADAVWLQLQAELELKSYNGIPFPESFFFYVGGYSPGINVDGMGIFWILGMGGGLDNIYESVFCVSEIPPVTLRLLGEFAVLTVLHANADLQLGFRGFDVEMSDIGLKLGSLQLNIFERMGISTYWYPKIKARASVDANIFDIIEGSGYIALEENTAVDEIYWEGLIEATIHTPSFGLIPSLHIADTEMGVNTFAMWGGVTIIGIDVGVTYYWGEDVDFAFGDYEAPEPILPAGLYAIPVYMDDSTGQILYMSLGTNAFLAANTSIANSMEEFDQIGTDGAEANAEEAKVTSSMDRLSHKINLGAYNGTKMMMTMVFDAETKAEAETIVLGKNGQSGIGITAADDESVVYPLKWIDNTKPLEEQQDANAIFGYDEETKQARVTISFAEEESFAHIWKLSAERETAPTVYEVKDLGELHSADYTFDSAANTMTANWTGEVMEDIEQLSVTATNEDGERYVLYETSDYGVIIGGGKKGTATFEVPAELPSGEYKIHITGLSQKNSVSTSVEAENVFSYTNPKQPSAPRITDITLGGDYSIDVNVAEGQYDGYIATVYEKQGDEWIASDCADQYFEADENGELPKTLTVGGQQNMSYYKDKDGKVVPNAEAEGRDDVTFESKTIGLEEDKIYRVGITGYRIDDDNILMASAETMSAEIQMVKPQKAQIGVQAKGIKAIIDAADQSAKLDVVTTKDVEIEITSDMKVSGEWILDNSANGSWSADETGTISLKNVEEGEHFLKLRGANEAGDGFQENYRFKVDTSAPRLQISNPMNGGFFGAAVNISGLCEPNAAVNVLLDGTQVRSHLVDETGSFTIPVNMDDTKLEQTLTIYAVDRAGNPTEKYEVTLLNDILNDPEVETAIYMNGEDVTNTSIPAGTTGTLEMRFKTAEESVTVPANSIIGRQAEWSTEMIDGTALLDGADLVVSARANGILKLTYDQQTAMTVLGENQKDTQYNISWDDHPVGYQIVTEDENTVSFGETFSFRVEIAEGYSALDHFAVKANGEELTAKDGLYEIKEIHSDKEITVEGVADINAPAAEITVKDNQWKSFLNNITFGTFFNKTQDVTITAEDMGSGLDKVFYFVSEKVMNVEEVKALAEADWTEYVKAFSIKPNAEYVIYAKAVDHDGNAAYISSDGIVLDDVAPVVTGIKDGETYMMRVNAAAASDDIVKITAGDKVLWDGNGETAEIGKEFTIEAAPQEQKIVVTDKAGNETVITIFVKRYSVLDIFEDVYDDWYTPYIQYVYDNDLMKGIGGTKKFMPESEITRAQVAQVFYNMEGKPKITDYKVFDVLSDVYENEWYADAVAWAYNNSIVTGYLHNMTFAPDDFVTREQLAVMMYRYSGYKGYDTSRTSSLSGLLNADKTSDWALAGVKWAVGVNLVSGEEVQKASGRTVYDLNPQGAATRAQMAAILMRFCEKVKK